MTRRTFTGCSFLDQELLDVDWNSDAEIAKRALASDADTARRRQEIDAERAAYMLAHDAEMARERRSRGGVAYRRWWIQQIAFDIWATECAECGCLHEAATLERLKAHLDREHPIAEPDDFRDRDGDLR